LADISSSDDIPDLASDVSRCYRLCSVYFWCFLTIELLQAILHCGSLVKLLDSRICLLLMRKIDLIFLRLFSSPSSEDHLNPSWLPLTQLSYDCFASSCWAFENRSTIYNASRKISSSFCYHNRDFQLFPCCFIICLCYSTAAEYLKVVFFFWLYNHSVYKLWNDQLKTWNFFWEWWDFRNVIWSGYEGICVNTLTAQYWTGILLNLTISRSFFYVLRTL
jgi:hypothetical protein